MALITRIEAKEAKALETELLEIDRSGNSQP